MKKTLLTILLMSMTIALNAQKKSNKAPCPEPMKANYGRVMSPAFAKEYTDCPVIIEGEFLKREYPKNYSVPMRLSGSKKGNTWYTFQCVSIEEPSLVQITDIGDFFVIEKDNSEPIFNLKRGDRIRVAGTTMVLNVRVDGKNVVPTPFFVVQKIEVIN
jgi:hypothetical protein